MFETPDDKIYTEYETLENLIDNMGVEREDVNENIVDHFPENTETDDFEDKEIEDFEETEDFEEVQQLDDYIPVVKKIDEKKARLEAKFLTETNDKLHAFICGLIAGEDTEDFEAEDDEKEDIQEAIYQWRKDAETHMPEWLQAVAFITVVYTPIYTRAFKTRKLKKENEALENELDAKDKEISELHKLISEINEREKRRLEREAEETDFQEIEQKKEVENEKES